MTVLVPLSRDVLLVKDNLIHIQISWFSYVTIIYLNRDWSSFILIFVSLETTYFI